MLARVFPYANTVGGTRRGCEKIESTKVVGTLRRADTMHVSSQSLAVVNVKKGVRLTEFNFCGETSPHMVCALTAKIEFCKPDPNTWNAGA
jgi:hypothetical protein